MRKYDLSQKCKIDVYKMVLKEGIVSIGGKSIVGKQLDSE